jgi:hypothetical protein
VETLNVEKLGIPFGRSLEPVRHVPIRIVGKRLRGYDASRFIAHIFMYGKGERRRRCGVYRSQPREASQERATLREVEDGRIRIVITTLALILHEAERSSISIAVA